MRAAAPRTGKRQAAEVAALVERLERLDASYVLAVARLARCPRPV